MRLLTLDEARGEITTSANAVLEKAGCDLATHTYLVWGSGPVHGLSATDNALALRHRALLDDLIDLGYEHEAIEEIEGCCSAAGVGDDEDLDTPAINGAPCRGDRPGVLTYTSGHPR